MIDLAERNSGAFIPLKDVAQRQEVSQKYMERIMLQLSKGGLVEGAHGKGGGYRLLRAPEDYRVGDILRLTEGSLAPVSCLECGASPCERAAVCRTLPMWSKLDEMIGSYLDSVTLADLLEPVGGGDYVI